MKDQSKAIRNAINVVTEAWKNIKPGCFPAHQHFAPACDPKKRGTLTSPNQMHAHCPECGRCYDCTNAPARKCDGNHRPPHCGDPECWQGKV